MGEGAESRMTAKQIKQRAKSELVVAIIEEWGYRAFIWFPGMTGAELEAWWVALQDVETFWRTERGTRERRRRGWPGDFIDAERTRALYDLWPDLLKAAPYWSHIDMNYQFSLTDSYTYLERLDGTMFLHHGASCNAEN